MAGVATTYVRTLRDHASIHGPLAEYDMMLTDLCAALFASLARNDQRRKGIAYVRGLLETPGRKSIRNIATLLGEPAAEQSLHHFISSSTWDWREVRRSLTDYVTRTSAPEAWVLRPMVIPKAGHNSVGVDRRFLPSLGQVVNAQQAAGVWVVGTDHAVPVNWRLLLSDTWLDDDTRRRAVAIPEGAPSETLGQCAVAAYLSMLTDWQVPRRPVVFDARETDALAVLRTLRAAAVPSLVRIDPVTPLAVTDAMVPRHLGTPLSALEIMRALGDLRRPTLWRDRPRDTGRTSLVATVRVALPRVRGGREGRHDEFLLLGVTDGPCWPAELWITDLMDHRRPTLLRLSRLVERVDREFVEISDQVGMRDFAGRSFDGWHRHVTLASAAHAIVSLGRSAWRYPRHAGPAPALLPRPGLERTRLRHAEGEGEAHGSHEHDRSPAPVLDGLSG